MNIMSSSFSARRLLLRRGGVADRLFSTTRARAIEGGGGGKKGFKRFYDKVTVHAPRAAAAEAEEEEEAVHRRELSKTSEKSKTSDGAACTSCTSSTDTAADMWQVRLDGRELKSPARVALRLPTEALATGVALEWDSMGEMIEPHLMPLFSAVSTVTDHLPANRALYISELKKYLDTDTCCIRAPEHEAELRALQEDTWDPLLGWMRDALGVELATTSAIGRPPHAAEAVDVVLAHMESLSDFQLQALFLFTNVCKSLTIGLALVHGRLSIDDAVAAARLEEEYQIAQWGMVEGGHDVDRAHINVQVASGRVLLRSAIAAVAEE
jgi:ATP synthase F1 complex assembly factor 2